MAKDAVKAFRAFLESRNLPLTRQRREIAQVILRSDRHLSAEDIMEELRRRKVSPGKATVYRTLDLLVQCDLIREHDFGEGFKRYEPRPGHPHHEHMICEECGRVVEFEEPDLDGLQAALAEEYGFEIRWHRLDLFGLCATCRRAKK